MAEARIPVGMRVAAKSVAQAKASLDPNLIPPANAKVDTGKDGKTYTRWTESGTVEQVWAESTKGEQGKAKLGVFVIGFRFRPGEPNQNKIAWFRLMLHPAIAAGNEVPAAIQASYGLMTERSLASLVSLLELAGKLPASGDLSEPLLAMLFPTKGGKSPLVGVKATVKIMQQPNTGGTRDKQEQAEVFLPVKEIVEDPKAPFGA